MKARSVALSLLAVLAGAACTTGRGPADPTPDIPASACRGDVLALMNGRLVRPDLGRAQPFRVLYVRGDRIVSPETVSRVQVERRCRLDLRGGYVTPGLTDAHVHLEYFAGPAVLRLFLASGVTTIRAMDGRPEQLRWRAATASGEIPGPRILVASPVFTSDAKADPEWVVVSDAGAASAKVGEAQAAGYDFVKVYHSLRAAPWSAVAAAAKARGLRVAGHLPQGADLSAPMWTVEHLDGFSDALPDGSDVKPWDWRARINAIPLDQAKLVRLIGDARRSGVALVPTLTALDWRFTDPSHRAVLDRAERVVRLPPVVRRFWSDAAGRQGSRMDQGDFATVRRGLEQSRRIVALADAAGVPIVAGTDAPQTYVVPGEGLIDELENYVAGGLSPARALYAATVSPARLFGTPGSGCLAPGCRADFLVTREDPLKTIGALREPLLVGFSGSVVGPATLAAWRTSLTDRDIVPPATPPAGR